MYTGTVTIPFGLNFPKNTELYKIMTTDASDKKKIEEEKKAKEKAAAEAKDKAKAEA